MSSAPPPPSGTSEIPAPASSALATAIEAVLPILSRLSRRVPERQYHPAGRESGSSVDHFPTPGLMVLGGPDYVAGISPDRGPVKGEALVVWADGTLAFLTYSGHWWRHGHDSSSAEWVATAVPTTVADAVATLGEARTAAAVAALTRILAG